MMPRTTGSVMNRASLAVLCTLLVLAAGPAWAQKRKAPMGPPGEDPYYKLLRYELPKDEVLEPGAIESLPGGRVAVGTRRGEIWILDNALADDPARAKFTRFAHG